jgi:putative transposase
VTLCCCGCWQASLRYLPSSCPVLPGTGQLGEKLPTKDLLFDSVPPAHLWLFPFVLGSGDCLRIQVLIRVVVNELAGILLMLLIRNFDDPGAGDFEVFHRSHLLSAGLSRAACRPPSLEDREHGVLACQNQAAACFDKPAEAVCYAEKAARDKPSWRDEELKLTVFQGVARRFGASGLHFRKSASPSALHTRVRILHSRDVYKSFKYRLYPTAKQQALLDGQLAEACRLYNAALQERRDAWKMRKTSITYSQQSKQLRDIRACADLRLANYSSCQDVLRRVDKTFQSFFRRIKKGQKAGYPRFKPQSRFHSYTFPAYGNGCKLRENKKLYIMGVGELKVKLHRPVAGRIKTVTLKREGGLWYVCFGAEAPQPSPLPATGALTGIDVGVSSFAVLSDGTAIRNPRYYQTAQMRLRRVQRKVCRRKKTSNRRRKAVQQLTRVHRHIKNQRNDFHHQVARKLINQYDVIAYENLNITGLARGRLAKPITDAGWGGFLRMLSDKAAEAGREIIRVNPHGTSQRCLCGARVAKTLAVRWHYCPRCQLSVPRDQAAALEILRLGLSRREQTRLSGVCVS